MKVLFCKGNPSLVIGLGLDHPTFICGDVYEGHATSILTKEGDILVVSFNTPPNVPYEEISVDEAKKLAESARH